LTTQRENCDNMQHSVEGKESWDCGGLVLTTWHGDEAFWILEIFHCLLLQNRQFSVWFI